MAIVGALLRHPYAGLFAIQVLGLVGLAPPEEVVLFAAGVVIARGKASGPLIFATATAGLVLCDMALYVAGRASREAFGRCQWLARFVPRLPERVSPEAARKGPLALLIGRWIPGVRPALLFTAGSAGWNSLRVAVIDAISATASCLLWTSLGVAGARQIPSALLYPGVIAISVAMILVVAATGWRRADSRKLS
jgi:membrane protein DedA with SNARE-associated domain